MEAPHFNVMTDLTKPCPHCGIPACGKEARLWTQVPDEIPVAVMFDGSLFDVMGEDYFSLHIASLAYADLPGFMKEWNECYGWNEFEGYESRRILPEELSASLKLIRQAGLSDWLMNDFIIYHDTFLSFMQSHHVTENGLYILRS